MSFGATLDEATAGTRVRGGVVLAATIERRFSYLVFVETRSLHLRNRSLGWGGPVIAAFPQPDGLHLVRPGGEIVTVELPPFVA